MAGNDATSNFFEALNESYDAVIDGIRKANDRTHRFTIAVIEDAQRGQREAVELARKWLDAPLDVQGFTGRAVDTATRGQGRTLDATRQFFNEMAEAQTEARAVFQRIVTANRAAGAAAADVARGAFSRTGEAIQSAGRNITETGKSTAEDGKSLPRETARTATSIIESNGGV